MQFLRINNRDNFLLSEVPIINPYSRRYTKWWKEQKSRCIEGFWSVDDKSVKVNVDDIEPTFPKSSNWRWIPPTAYFYVNFGTILRNKKGATSGAKVFMRPSLDDVEWEFAYNWMEARGFSGFEFDEKYSCNRFLEGQMIEGKVVHYTDEELIDRCLDENDEVIPLLYNNFFKKDGTRKEFIHCRKYIRELKDNSLGRPIYGNIPQNLMLLGTRDGGKSYLVANQGIAHELIFDGARYYDKSDPTVKSVAELVVGAAISDKSKDLLKKVKYTVDHLPGVWKKGTPEEVPCPFYKHMSGNFLANKEWVHSYKKIIGNDWKDAGTGSMIKHRVFTTENPEAAAGGRPGTIVLEEVGLVGNLLAIHGSNDAAQNDGGEKFGSTLYIGTAGNMEKILEPEIVFNAPNEFDFVEFDNIWEETGQKICWFIPATHMARRFKDNQGNTKIAEATTHFEKRRERKKGGASNKSIDTELMNYPMKPSEMFLNKTNNKFPIADVKIRIRDLCSNNNDEIKLTFKGFYSLDKDGNVKFERDTKAHPIREYPLKKDNVGGLEGCIEMFEPPIKNNEGFVPAGIYGAALDPVDDDGNDDISQSLQSFYIMNLLTDRIVLEYTARTKFAKNFYEQARRALIDYNCTLLYENQKKGLYNHFDQKNSLYLLEDTPQALKDAESQKGNFTGNRSKGVYNTDKLKYWGEQELLPNYLDSQAYGAEKGVTNLQIFKSLGALREMTYYNGKVNTDRISSLGILMIVRELKLKHKIEVKKKKRKLSSDDFWNRHRN